MTDVVDSFYWVDFLHSEGKIVVDNDPDSHGVHSGDFMMRMCKREKEGLTFMARFPSQEWIFRQNIFSDDVIGRLLSSYDLWSDNPQLLQEYLVWRTKRRLLTE